MKEERRTDIDRRDNNHLRDRLCKSNRRNRPDRRLNNIAMEWVPMENVLLHPTTRRVFSRN